jgi:hypothetical protein
MASEKTLELRKIKPSSNWDKWKDGDFQGNTRAGKKRFVPPKKKKKKILGYDLSDVDNVEEGLGSFTKKNTAQIKFLDRQSRRIIREQQEALESNED